MRLHIPLRARKRARTEVRDKRVKQVQGGRRAVLTKLASEARRIQASRRIYPGILDPGSWILDPRSSSGIRIPNFFPGVTN